MACMHGLSLSLSLSLSLTGYGSRAMVCIHRLIICAFHSICIRLYCESNFMSQAWQHGIDMHTTLVTWIISRRYGRWESQHFILLYGYVTGNSLVGHGDGWSGAYALPWMLIHGLCHRAQSIRPHAMQHMQRKHADFLRWVHRRPCVHTGAWAREWIGLKLGSLAYQQVQNGPSVRVAPYVVCPHFQMVHALITCVKLSSAYGWQAAACWTRYNHCGGFRGERPASCHAWSSRDSTGRW